MRRGVVVACVLLAALIAGRATADTKAKPCPVTPPNGRPLPSLYGNGRLATTTYYPGGVAVTSRTLRPDGWIEEKFPWRAYGVTGVLKITGRRLDGTAPPVRAAISDGIVEENGVSAFWAVGIIFPTTGCWRITGTVGTTRLSFVTQVVDNRS